MLADIDRDSSAGTDSIGKRADALMLYIFTIRFLDPLNQLSANVSPVLPVILLGALYFSFQKQR